MKDPTKKYHVMPVKDWKEHIDSKDCWCKPTASIDEPNVIIHNSLDGREVKELRDKVLPNA